MTSVKERASQRPMNGSVLPPIVSGEGHPRGNGDGPQTRTTRRNERGSRPC